MSNVGTKPIVSWPRKVSRSRSVAELTVEDIMKRSRGKKSTCVLHEYLKLHDGSPASRDLTETDSIAELDRMLAAGFQVGGKNAHNETALHFATSSSLSCPTRVLNKLITAASPEVVKMRDNEGRTALDRLIQLDDREMAKETLELFSEKGVDFMSSSGYVLPPLIGLIQRTRDGHKSLKFVLGFVLGLANKGTLQKAWPFIFKIALKDGSARTLEVLLDFEKEKKLLPIGEPLLHGALTTTFELNEKVDVLLKRSADYNLLQQKDNEERNWLHAVAENKPPWFSRACDVLRSELDKKDVAMPDKQGDTPLHKVAKTYAELDSENPVYVKALRTLLNCCPQHNVRNKFGLTPLQCLLSEAQFTPSQAVVDLFFDGFLINENVQETPNPHEYFPLATLARRRDGPSLFDCVKQKEPNKLNAHLQYMLEVAVSDGCPEMVRHILKCDVAISASDRSSLLLQASLSNHDPAQKMRDLSDKQDSNRQTEAELETEGPDSKPKPKVGRTLLHAAAGSTQPSVDALVIAVERLHVDAYQRDVDGSTALHIAAGNQNEGSSACVNYLLTKMETDRQDPCGECPLPMTALGSLLNSLFTLKDSDPLPRDTKEKVIALLEKGVSSEDLRNDLYWLGHQHKESNCDCKYKGKVVVSRNPPNPKMLEKIFLDPEVIISSPNPIYLLLVLGEYCRDHTKSLQKRKWRDGDKEKERRCHEDTLWREILKWKALNKSLEEEAMALIAEFGKYQTEFKDVMTEMEIFLAHDIGWKQFLSQKSVSSSLQEIFCGHTTGVADETEKDQSYWESSRWRERWQQSQGTQWESVYLFSLLLLFLLQTALLPLLLPFYAIRNRSVFRNRENESSWHWRVCLPLPPGEIPLVTWTTNAIGYVTFVGILIARTSHTEREDGMATWDWIVIVYIVALLGQEWQQVRVEGMTYIFKPSNVFDIGMLVLLITGYLIRGVGFASSNEVELQSLYLRVSEILLGFAIILACLRLLGYLMIFRRIGTIQTSFQEIGKNVLYFLVILGVFLLAFAVGITGIYKGAAYDTEAAPKAVDGVWSSLVTLYWSLFGMIGFTDLSREADDVTPLTVEMISALCVFALWLLVSIIVLLNMLIALINYAFEDVHENNAVLVWNIAYISVIKETREFYPFPPPMNLLQILADLIYFCFYPKLFWDQKAVFEEAYRFTCRVGKTKDSRSQVLLMKEAYRISRGSFENDAEKNVSEQISQLANRFSELSQATAKSLEEMQENNLKLQQRLLLAGEDSCFEQDQTDSSQEQQRCSTLSVDSQLLNFSSPAETAESSLPTQSSEKEDGSSDESPHLPTKTASPAIKKERVEVHLQELDVYNVIYTPGECYDVGSFRAISHPISQCKYFEVKIRKWGYLGYIGVGLAEADYPMEMQPGWGAGSIGVHADDGKLFVENGTGKPLTSPFQEGDCIGCGIEEDKSPHPSKEKMVYFLRRRGDTLEKLCSVMFKVSPGNLFPTVGMHSGGEKVEVFLNFKGKQRASSIDSKEVDKVRQNVMTGGFVCQGVFVRAKAVCYVSDAFNSVGVCQCRRKCSWFQVRVVTLGKTGDIFIGYAPKDGELKNQPGWSQNSVSFRCNDGCLYREYSFGRLQIGAPAVERDVIKCEKAFNPDGSSGTVNFWLNNIKLQEVKMDDVSNLYPTVGMRSDEAVVIFETGYVESACKKRISNRSPNIHVYDDVIVSSGDGREKGSCQWKEKMSPNFLYFDVEILSTGKSGKISIGLAEKGFPYYRLPGLVPGSVGYHCESGKLLEGYGRGSGREQVSKQGTVIRCKIEEFRCNKNEEADFKPGSMLTVSFMRQGFPEKNLKTKMRWPKNGLYPTVGLVSNGEVVCITPGSAYD